MTSPMKLPSPKTSSRSSLSWANSLSSMLAISTPRSPSSSCARRSRGAMNDSHAEWRVCASAPAKRAPDAKSGRPVLGGGGGAAGVGGGGVGAPAAARGGGGAPHPPQGVAVVALVQQDRPLALPDR